MFHSLPIPNVIIFISSKSIQIVSHQINKFQNWKWMSKWNSKKDLQTTKQFSKPKWFSFIFISFSKGIGDKYVINRSFRRIIQRLKIYYLASLLVLCNKDHKDYMCLLNCVHQKSIATAAAISKFNVIYLFQFWVTFKIQFKCFEALYSGF